MTRPKFILVDPSFVDQGGDKWQYAVTFARSAQKGGYRFVLLTHELAPKIQRHLRFGIHQRNVFHHAFYEHDKIVDQVRTSRSKRLRRWLNRRFEKTEAYYSRAIGRAQERRDGVKERALRLAYSGQRGVQQLLSASVLVYERLVGTLETDVNADLFGIALAKELKALDLKKGDRLFFHTMTQAMMESLTETTAALEGAEPLDVDAHFLFHFGATAPDASTFVNRYYSFAHPGTLKDRLLAGAPFRRLHIHATSRVLADELEDQLGIPVSVFAGLTNYDHYLAAIGGEQIRLNLRKKIADEVASVGKVRLVVRVSDLDRERCIAASRTAHLIQHRGFSVDLRFLYTDGSLGNLRELLAVCDFPYISLANTTDNEAYLRELVNATVVLLPYAVAKYEKRVSAVLHDAAVLGVPAVVPAGSTLADAEMCAAVYVYTNLNNVLGATLNAVRALNRDPQSAERQAVQARERYASDVIQRLIASRAEPSLHVQQRRGIANVIHPMWGRCGSSFAFEAQINLLLRSGYFVNQIILASDAVDLDSSYDYIWRMLQENSANTRGCIQRVFFPVDKGARSPRGRNYFDQLANTIASSPVRSGALRRLFASARMTIVNHVFNSKWAFRHGGGRKVLDSHDIQSIAFASRSVRNGRTGHVDSLREMLKSEGALIRKFDYVVNCANEEHVVLGEFNSNAVLVTPHVPQRTLRACRSMRDLAVANSWHESYYLLEKFDLLIAGDGHPANVASALWFVRKVFIPFLQPHGTSLAICGRLSHEVHEAVGEVGYVFYAGFVDNLDDVRALSKVAVLPDQAGTGVSIKTLEAFATGMAFVGTSHSLRGLPRPLPEGLRGVDDPRLMASEILRAIKSEEKRATLSDLAQSCYQHYSSLEVWEPRWKQALGDMRRSRSWLPKVRQFAKWSVGLKAARIKSER